MIVTADPLGDFNATSQILRYSALAREVTVPRIPSVTSTILSGSTGAQKTPMETGRTSPSNQHADNAVVELAFSEIARLSEEVEVLKVKLEEEQGRRREAEEEWQKAEDRGEEIEIRVREECWQEMERRTDEERRRWMSAWSEEVSSAFVIRGTKPLFIFSRPIEMTSIWIVSWTYFLKEFIVSCFRSGRSSKFMVLTFCMSST